ncbi:BRCT domain-containing protein [Amylocarpus encephaloides]|uniref:BRCT domain-containing protein n=1 Tax=Amylocarpus encephaloides TaxID=45428 RepID=A0A9P7YT44_9HELO|nr:BRCT domain-containing protein [Amylocarpus encephaloides]
MAGHGAPIFEHCVFSFVESRDNPAEQISEVQKTIEDHAGIVLRLKRGNQIKLDEVTHIIATTSDFPQYSDARNAMINVVKPTWILDSLYKNKAAPTRPHTPDPNLIFSSTTICCADIPSGDKDAVVGGVLAMGGSESSTLTKLCTHLCALTMDHPKCQLVKEKNLKCKIVLPHWFDDCLRLGKRISEEPYLLPNPEIVSAGPDDFLKIPSSDHIHGASSPRPESLPILTDSPRRLDVFKKKAVMISQDLAIGSRLRKVIEDLIIGGGGSMTSSVHSADMYICHWRGGRDYQVASYAGKDVGNLSWLYHLITHNEWTSPMKRLLHYPLPESGIEGFSGFQITLSNYGGEARTYLENLIMATGATFTKSMKETNTHVITARNSGEKCSAASEWDIEMVNHLWIEESYARCHMQRMTDPRYTHFPPRTNLGEVIGQTPFDMELIQGLYFPNEPTPSPSNPRSLKRPVMHDKDPNLSHPKIVEEDGSASEQEDQNVSQKPVAKSKKPAAVKSRTNSFPAANVSTPSANRRISAGKENNTPSSTSSRSAKDRALSNLHGLAPDIALYEKEKKRKGAVWGGERALNKIDKQGTAERSSSPAAKDDEGELLGDEDTRTPKRQRTGLPPIGIRLLITSYDTWVDNPTKEDSDKKKLRELGILVVPDARQGCTHLAAPKMVRTKKFLCALAIGPTIVRTDFIEACVKKGHLPNVESFALKDADAEKKFNVKLKEVIVRAKANKHSLLRRIPIYSTKDVPSGSETYRDIVSANGGTLSVFNGRPVIKKVNPEEDVTGPEPVYLLSGEKPEERKLWPKFVAMAKDGNMIPRIVTPNWLLDVSMAQQLIWKELYLLEGQ